MKSLMNLDNTAKAKLLHELFPEEIASLIDNLKQVCADLETNAEIYRQTWDSGLFRFDQWLSLAAQVEDRIKKFERDIIRSSKVFSDQLCFGYQTMFVNDRIVKYATSVSENEKFKLMVKVLYY